MRGEGNICSTNGFVPYFVMTKAVYPYAGLCSREMRSGCTCVACDTFVPWCILLHADILFGLTFYPPVASIRQKSLKYQICRMSLLYAIYSMPYMWILWGEI